MRAVILTYHRIGKSFAGDDAVTPAEFERQMSFLASSGYEVIDIDQLMPALTLKSMPLQKVVITFDDGLDATCEGAIAVLRKYRFPATFFLIGGLMGQSASWLPRQHRLIDWNGARFLIRQGFGIGSHSLTHRRLDQLTFAEAGEEITGSKRSLEDGLGVPVRFFAYPHGRWNKEVRDLVARAGYSGACTTASGFNGPSCDPFALRRIEINGKYSMHTFKRSITFGENSMTLTRELQYYSSRVLARLGIRRHYET